MHRLRNHTSRPVIAGHFGLTELRQITQNPQIVIRLNIILQVYFN